MADAVRVANVDPHMRYRLINVRHRFAMVVAFGLSVSSAPVVQAVDYAETGFRVTAYATGLTQPVALAFSPDGRLFVAEKSGAIRIVEPGGAVRAQPFVTVPVITLLESGLLGLCLDPDFAQNHYVYAFATVSNEEQRIIRWTEQDGVATREHVIKDHLPSIGTFHNGGCLKVGPDRKLYFSIGDNTLGENSQDIATLAGKISRINLDGSVPADNPFTTPTGAPRAIWALGFRNPFRFTFAPEGRLIVLDVGSDLPVRREEINIVRAGDNGGWPYYEGRPADIAEPQYLYPAFEYIDQGSSPTGAVYYDAEQFPAAYRGQLYHVEYTLNRIYRVILDGDSVVDHQLFVQGDGGMVDMVLGPDGSLYYTEIIAGNIKRVSTEQAADVLGFDGQEQLTLDDRPPTLVFCGQFQIPIALLTLAGSCGLCRRAR